MHKLLLLALLAAAFLPVGVSTFPSTAHAQNVDDIRPGTNIQSNDFLVLSDSNGKAIAATELTPGSTPENFTDYINQYFPGSTQKKMSSTDFLKKYPDPLASTLLGNFDTAGQVEGSQERR
jgi:hypothetical protein